jgi:hypothetical protein
MNLGRLYNQFCRLGNVLVREDEAWLARLSDSNAVAGLSFMLHQT